eukprot:6096445-Amphidinium_carterae.1
MCASSYRYVTSLQNTFTAAWCTQRGALQDQMKPVPFSGTNGTYDSAQLEDACKEFLFKNRSTHIQLQPAK